MDIERLPISRRLKMNASLVPECELLADVGCDHAYTCLYLVAGGVAKRALALDVRSGPLSRAQENIRRYGMEGRIGTRLSDGLCALAASEADCILICGMGGPLMIDILTKDWEKVLAAKCIVLQPQSEIAQVRSFLHKMGLEIDAEDMCKEDGKYYTVMRAGKGMPQDGAGEDMDWAACGKDVEECAQDALFGTDAKERALSAKMAYQYGRCLIKQKHPVLKEYVQHELAQKRAIGQQLAREASARAAERLMGVREEISLLEKVAGVLGRGRERN